MENFRAVLKTIKDDQEILRSLRHHQAMLLAQHYNDGDKKMHFSNMFADLIIKKYPCLAKEEVLLFVMIKFNSLYDQYKVRADLLAEEQMDDLGFVPLEIIKEKLYEKTIINEMLHEARVDGIASEWEKNNWIDDDEGTLSERITNIGAVHRARTSQTKNILAWERKQPNKHRQSGKESLKSLLTNNNK
jgi:hypothetical protein